MWDSAFSLILFLLLNVAGLIGPKKNQTKFDKSTKQTKEIRKPKKTMYKPVKQAKAYQNLVSVLRSLSQPVIVIKFECLLS